MRTLGAAVNRPRARNPEIHPAQRP